MLTQHYSSQLSTVNCDRSSIDFVMSEELVVGTGQPLKPQVWCWDVVTVVLHLLSLTSHWQEILYWHSPPLLLSWMTARDIVVNVLGSERIMSIDVDIDLWLVIRLKFHPNLSEYIIYNINIQTMTVTVLQGKDSDTCWCNYATQEAYWGKANSQH